MIRKLIASLAIVTCCMGNPLPAQAEYTTCWFDQGDGAETIPSQPCDLEVVEEKGTKYIYIYTPSDDSTVKLALFFQGDKPAYVNLYDPKSGKKVGTMFFESDKEGDVRVYNSEYEFYFRWPGNDTVETPSAVFGEGGVTA